MALEFTPEVSFSVADQLLKNLGWSFFLVALWVFCFQMLAVFHGGFIPASEILLNFGKSFGLLALMDFFAAANIVELFARSKAKADVESIRP